VQFSRSRPIPPRVVVAWVSEAW